MKNQLTKLLMWVFTRPCPNCESAWTGGDPNPEDLTYCVVCSDPKTGKIRGWAWRWKWWHRTFVTAANIRKLKAGGRL